MPVEVIIAIIILLFLLSRGREEWIPKIEKKRSDIYEVLDLLKTKIEAPRIKRPSEKILPKKPKTKKAERKSVKEKLSVPEKEKIQEAPTKQKPTIQEKPIEEPKEKIDKIRQDNEKSLEELFGIVGSTDKKKGKTKEELDEILDRMDESK